MADQYIQQGNQAVSEIDVKNALNNPNAAALATPTIAVPPVTTSSTIPVAQVQSTPALQIPGPEVKPDSASALVDGVKAGQKTTQDYINELTAPTTDTQKTQSKLITDLETLLPELGGKKKALAAEEEKQGVNTLTKDLADLNGQLTIKVAEYQKLLNETEKNSNFKGSYSAKANELKRTMAAEVGMIQANILAKQGNLQAAKDVASRTIDLQYESREDEFNLKLKHLEIIQPILDKEEKISAQALQNKLNDEKVALAEKKEKQKTNAALALELGTKSLFANKGGEFFRVSDGMPITDPAEFFKLAGVSSFEEAYQRGIVTDVTSDMLADRDFVAKARVSYPDAGIQASDSADVAAAKVKKSAIFRKETYIAPPSGSGGGFGNYTEDQLKAITKINQDVSKNATYAKTTSMRNYVDNVLASLSQGSGVGDIAAINQFQKVIDEGAVTRDQDVKLIQGSQSLANTLKTKMKKLEKGDQLSPELRSQIRKAAEDMYNSQTKALLKDPYIAAKNTEAGLYGLTARDTILGELGGFDSSSNTSEDTFTVNGVTYHLGSDGLYYAQ